MGREVVIMGDADVRSVEEGEWFGQERRMGS